MALTAGACIVFRKNGRLYLYILLTKPEGHPPRGLFVTFEHLDSAMSDDPETALCGEHPFFRTPMTPVFRGLVPMFLDHIEADIDNPNSSTCLHHSDPVCSDDLLQTLRAGVSRCQAVVPKYRTYCENNS